MIISRYAFISKILHRSLSWCPFHCKQWKIHIWASFKAQEEAESSEDQGRLQIKARLFLIDLSAYIVNLL